MTIVSLSRVLDQSFIQRLETLAQGTTKANQKVSEAVTLSAGLRLGANAMVSAISLLSSGGTVLNTTQDTLTTVQDLLTKMTGYADQAADSTTGSEQRAALGATYQQAARELGDILTTASKDSVNYLSRTGLDTVFQSIGLTVDNLSNLKSILDRLSTTGTDGALVSPELKAERPVSVPRGLPTDTVATEYASVLDETVTLSSRRQAYTVAADLRKISEQVKNNQTVIADATAYVFDSQRLARSLGLSLLTAADAATGGQSLDALTFQLQTEVRRNGPGTLHQLEAIPGLVEKATSLLSA